MLYEWNLQLTIAEVLEKALGIILIKDYQNALYDHDKVAENENVSCKKNAG